MGFWHTGYMEFHEPIGLDGHYAITPPVFRCRFCSLIFTSFSDMRNHRFEAHPYNRPILYIKGSEVGETPVRITTHLLPNDIRVERFSDIALNGDMVSISDLVYRLSCITRDTISLELKNEHVSAIFTLRFEIADKDHLAGIDRRFLDIAHGRRLSLREIERFIDASRLYSTAIGYCNGICEYLYGILAKERMADTSLPYEGYREKFTRAADQLQGFDRPLARMIGGLISFHFNHFGEAAILGGTSRLGMVSERYANWIAGSDIDVHEIPIEDMDGSLEKVITDFQTEQILSWSIKDYDQMDNYRNDMLDFRNQDIPEFDKTKIDILMSQSALYRGDTKEALSFAKRHRNSPALGVWAERVINVCQTQK